MDQRNIRVIIGLLLLTALTVYINSTNVTHIMNEEDENQPFWVWLLPWQGEQERSVRVHQGLDLQGGLQVVLEADLEPGQEPAEGVMDAARGIVENRVNGLGVTEPLVQLQGDRRLIVELPGVDDPELAISTIRETGLLEFVDGGLSEIPEGMLIRTTLGDPRVAITDTETVTATQAIADLNIYNPETVYETIITGGDLQDVTNAGFDPQTRETNINFRLKSEGASAFGAYSGRNIGNFLCIVLDKRVLSCPVIQGQITTQGTISLGDTTLNEAQALAIQLRYGSLPVALKVVENRSVGPTLGQDSVNRSIRAGTIGLAVVLLFMAVYYRLPGVVAGFALVLYGLMNFALYKLIPVTITLPAATGFILSVGMAVDANILVFERLKEELRAGKKMRRAMELGFLRAWPSIRDSAISTLITCAILFWFGSNFGASIVKGFAITLALGVVTNIFTAVVVTRALLRFAVAVAGDGLQNNAFLMGFNLDESDKAAPGWAASLMDIVGRRHFYFAFSGVLISLGIASMIYSASEFGTPLKLSVDFTSGSLMELQFDEVVTPGQVREVFADYTHVGTGTGVLTEYNDTDVTTAEQLGLETILIRSKFLEEEARVQLLDLMETELGSFTELRFDSVGPAIGEEVAQAGILAVLAASMAILLFLMYAFRSIEHAARYGIAAVVAMLHDILITAGIFAICGVLLGWEVDALFLTAILTVIGYSVHDTIIVFDRLRENIPIRRGEGYDVIANRSVLETLNRSIATSLSTLFVVVSIMAFGGATITQFIAILLIGVISGTYSSIFTAVPMLVAWQYGELRLPFGRKDSETPARA